MQDSGLKRVVRDTKALAAKFGSDFPRIVAVDEQGDAVTLTLEVSPDLVWFRGHFPDQPVLPGIIQLHWAVSVAAVLYAHDEPPQHIKRLKFSNVIVPPRTVVLTLVPHGDLEVQFSIRSDGAQHSQGRLVFPEPGR